MYASMTTALPIADENAARAYVCGGALSSTHMATMARL